MLIVLSELLREDDLRMPLSQRARDALINLSTAAYEGKHLLAGSRRIFENLQELGLDDEPSNRFKEATAYIADAQTLRSKIPAYIHVQPIGQSPHVEIVSTPSVTGQIVFNVPLDHFADSEQVGRSWLMAEHIHDADSYAAFGQAYAQRFRGFRCALRKADGHGGATPHTFESFAEQDMSVLCIVDSDRHDPTAKLGQTATDALARQETVRARGKVATVHILPCRELENLLPAALVVEALPEDPKHPHRVKVLAQQHRLGKIDFDELKELVKLEQVSATLTRLPARECAKLCFSTHACAALEEVSALVCSFGLASRRGRT